MVHIDPVTLQLSGRFPACINGRKSEIKFNFFFGSTKPEKEKKRMWLSGKKKLISLKPVDSIGY